jgi:hypothetical protein
VNPVLFVAMVFVTSTFRSRGMGSRACPDLAAVGCPAF